MTEAETMQGLLSGTVATFTLEGRLRCCPIGMAADFEAGIRLTGILKPAGLGASGRVPR